MATRSHHDRATTAAASGEKGLWIAASEGDLTRFKEIARRLDKGDGIAAVVAPLRMGGFGLLHLVASQGDLFFCMYLVEELGFDVNMTADGGLTQLMASAQSGDINTVKYFLDRGCDPLKHDDKGSTALHHAAAAGSCKVLELLLAKGIPVDIDNGFGTPLYHAAINEQDKTLKILLDHHANPNTVTFHLHTPLLGALVYRSLRCMKLLIKAGANVNGNSSSGMTPLIFAATMGGLTDFVKFLLKAGADPNIRDDLGRLPIELVAIRDCWEEVEILFPVTSPIPEVPNWSIEGVISYAKARDEKVMDQSDRERRKALLKSQGDMAFKKKEYDLASKAYTLAIEQMPDAVLYSNRSLCKLLMGDGEGALLDAHQCRMMRPNWPKACYREAAAFSFLQDYEKARDALVDGVKLDPTNAEMEKALREVVESMEKLTQ